MFTQCNCALPYRMSSSRSSKPSYYTSITKTLEAIKSVEDDFAKGDFATGGMCSLPLPGITMRGAPCGCLSLPLCECQVKIVMARSDIPSRAAKSSVNQHIWQLSPAAFSITSHQWASSLQYLLSRITEKLGCDSNLTISCKLYKLLLCGPGNSHEVCVCVAKRGWEKYGIAETVE